MPIFFRNAIDQISVKVSEIDTKIYETRVKLSPFGSIK